MEIGGPANEYIEDSNGRVAARNTYACVGYGVSSPIASQFEVLPILWQSHLA